MAGLQERVEEWEDEEELEQGFGCHGFLCSHWLLRRSGGAPSRSLLHGHGSREELRWKRNGRKAKQVVLGCLQRQLEGFSAETQVQMQEQQHHQEQTIVSL